MHTEARRHGGTEVIPFPPSTPFPLKTTTMRLSTPQPPICLSMTSPRPIDVSRGLQAFVSNCADSLLTTFLTGIRRRLRQEWRLRELIRRAAWTRFSIDSLNVHRPLFDVVTQAIESGCSGISLAFSGAPGRFRVPGSRFRNELEVA